MCSCGDIRGGTNQLERSSEIFVVHPPSRRRQSSESLPHTCFLSLDEPEYGVHCIGPILRNILTKGTLRPTCTFQCAIRHQCNAQKAESLMATHYPCKAGDLPAAEIAFTNVFRYKQTDRQARIQHVLCSKAVLYKICRQI